MGVKSSIETELEDDDRKALDQLIMDGKLTLDRIVKWLDEKGYGISRSAVGRHAKKVESVGAKLRQSRVMTEALVTELGPDISEGKQGRVLVEVLRTLTFDLMSGRMSDDSDTDEFDTKDVANLAKALKDLASANKIDFDRELKIREEAEKKAKVEAAARVKEVIKGQKGKGITEETKNAIIDGILGRS